MTSTRLAIWHSSASSRKRGPARAAQTLDYETFKTKVEPIFLMKRTGHARCVVCHAESNNAFRLQRLGVDGT